MSMCPLMFDHSPSSSMGFCDKMHIDYLIDRLFLCQYNICSFIMFFSDYSRPAQASYFTCKVNYNQPQRWLHSLIPHPLNVDTASTIQLLFIKERIVINQAEMHRFPQWAIEPLRTPQLIYLCFMFQRHLSYSYVFP